MTHSHRSASAHRSLLRSLILIAVIIAGFVWPRKSKTAHASSPSHATKSPTQSSPPIISLNWAVVLIILAFSAGAWLSMTDPFSSSTPATTVVKTTRDLSAFTVLASSDITTTVVAEAPHDALTTISAPTDMQRITTAALEADSIVSSTKLATVSTGWLLLSVPYTSTVMPKVNETVVVLGAKADQEVAELISKQAIVLGRENNRIVVALPEEEARRATAYLIEKRQLVIVRQVS